MFNLSQIKETQNAAAPVRTLVYGPHKIGKSTFAAGAPSPVFIQTEDGLEAINAKAFPLCQKWGDILDALTSLYQEKHEFKNVVIDSADWAERLAHAIVCKENSVDGIEKIGYGKGYSFSADLFSELFEALNALRNDKGMGVVIIAHAEIKTFNDPQNDSYDRYQVKLHKTIGKLVQEWADVIGFAQLDTITKIEKKKGFKDERTRAITSGNRVLRLVGTPAFDAGNRFGLPETIPLDWADYQAALDAARKAKE